MEWANFHLIKRPSNPTVLHEFHFTPTTPGILSEESTYSERGILMVWKAVVIGYYILKINVLNICKKGF